MKKHILRFPLLVLFFCFFYFSSKATHIVGGDIAVRNLSPNNFEITLTLFFDCINGNPAAFDYSTEVGIFDKVTNVMQSSVYIPFIDSLTLQLGDSCYIPPNLCVRRLRYIDTVLIPNNPNGYYLSWHRCCRNGIINNIVNSGSSGNVFYAEIPNPAIINSTPTFDKYPDAYMCAAFANIDSFTATDIDGDSLVYSLRVPLDCSANGICSSTYPIPIATSGPYGTVTWQPPYSATNIMGDPSMAIGNQSGIITTNPPAQGVFVFCVRVEEYRNNIKIGEIRRDVQYAVLPCGVPKVNVSGPSPLCLGQSSTLSASGGQNYTWNTGQTTGSIVVSPTAAGTYTFVVSTTKGMCIDTAQAIITVYPLPIPTATAADDTICIGTSTVLTATGGATYSWSPSATLNNTSAANPTATPVITTTYSVLATSAYGCTATTTVIVSTANSPIVNFSAPGVCVGDTTYFTDLSTIANGNIVSWLWDFGDGNISTNQNPTHVYTSAGTYNVSLTLVSDANCMTSLILPVLVYPPPDAQFSISPGPVADLTDNILFTDLSTGLPVQWSWDFGDGSTSSVQFPSHVYTDTGTYVIMLIIVSQYGCIDSIENPITLKEFDFYIPNAFTPNGDGYNDFFFGKGVGITEYEMHIYDRWGNEIFSCSVNDLPQTSPCRWDGKVVDGPSHKAVQEDVYVWKVKLFNVLKRQKTYIGHVTVIR